ncbi:hypothetical protein, conserved [Eimeria necatrix]|uniref:Protein MEMO1 n=1 Tax=Eimeria necatrix TaxID=51315 RepID=U6N6V7_9EIME|nr:hypothetical protein, conserved [Eimeria necatrix]CDJ70430.1 hypothetical protein, conserved [Eimeria necatrix]
MGVLRPSYQAGTWFPGTAAELRAEVDSLLESAETFPGTVKAIAVPHAAFVYSGSTAAVGYKQMQALQRRVKRVLLLAPWHQEGFGLLLPPEEFTAFGTPIVLRALLSTGLYDTVAAAAEKDEHSIALQIPFLKTVLPEGTLLVPVYVGRLFKEDLSMYAETLVPFFMDPDTVFVISTDWSHWGPRSNYSYLPENVDKSLPLYKKIQALDREAIDCVVNLNGSCLEEHVAKTHNRICGYDALLLFLRLLERVAESSGQRAEDLFSASLLAYSQSSPIRSASENAVGYAAIGFYSAEEMNK